METKKEELQELGKTWCSEIEKAERYWSKFFERGTKIDEIYQKYSNKKQDEESNPEIALFWSNIQIEQPALYTRLPKTEVERRHKDKDVVARVSAQLLERAIDVTLEDSDAHDTFQKVVQDMLIPGRGSVWLRYEPTLAQKSVSLSNNVSDKGEPIYLDDEGEEYFTGVKEEPKGQFFFEELADEEVCIDYVFWKDFLCSPARTWEQVRWVGRKVYLLKGEVSKRFSKDIANKLNYSAKEKDSEDKEVLRDQEVHRRACVYEIWDKVSRKTIFFSKDFPDKILEITNPPVNFQKFFPCPRPLCASTTNSSIVPVADYVYYQDQLVELDEIQQRKRVLLDALRVAGFYDKNLEELKSLETHKDEFTLIPVENWQRVKEKGGVSNLIEFIPLQEAVTVLEKLYLAEEKTKQNIYEIKGISEIIRGASQQANTTATETQTKSQFATLRLSSRQGEVQRFIRDVARLSGEIIAEMFQPTTFAIMTGQDFLSETDAQVPQVYEQAVDLIKQEKTRKFRISIETDSTIAVNEQLEKEKRNEFMAAVGQFLQQTMQTAQTFPPMLPLIGEMMMWSVRGMRTGRNLESAMQTLLDGLNAQQKQMQEQPQNPSPEEIQAQYQQQMDAQKMQLEQEKAMAKAEVERFKAESKVQLDQFKAAKDLEIKQMKVSYDAQLAAEKVKADMAMKQFEFSNQQLDSARNQPKEQAPIIVNAATRKVITLPDGRQAISETIAE